MVNVESTVVEAEGFWGIGDWDRGSGIGVELVIDSMIL